MQFHNIPQQIVEFWRMHLPCVIALVMFKKQGRNMWYSVLVCGIMKNAPAMCNSTAGREFCGIL